MMAISIIPRTRKRGRPGIDLLDYVIGIGNSRFLPGFLRSLKTIPSSNYYNTYAHAPYVNYARVFFSEGEGLEDFRT